MPDRIVALIREYLAFTAWSNFTSPSVLGAWAIALAGIACIALCAWCAGHLVLRDAARFRSASEEAVVKVTLGLAVCTSALFFLALFGLFRIPAVLATACAVVLAASAPRIAQRPTWRAGLLRAPCSLVSPLRVALPVTLAVGFTVVLSMTALLPPATWDVLMFHLAYPRQWAAAGGLTVDPFAWYPFYTWNWQLLHGVALLFHAESLTNMLGWLASALVAAIVALMLRRFGTGRGVSVLGGLAFVVTPLTLRLMDSAMVDIPIMLFLTAAVWLLLIADEGSPRTLVAAAWCVGMFMGLKVTALAYVPLFALLAATRLRRRSLVLYVGCAVAVSSPWYAYNLVQSGDPAPPLVSSVLGRPALYWNAEDLAWHRDALALNGERGIRQFVRLSGRMLRPPPPPSLEKPGPSPTMSDGPLLGYVLVFPFTLLFIPALRRRGALAPLLTAWYGTAVFVLTTFRDLRYMTALPLVIVCATLLVSVLLEGLARRAPRLRLALLAAVVIGPTLAAPRYVRAHFHWPIPVGDSARHAFMLQVNPQFAAIDRLREIAPPPARVYVTNNGGVYEYEKAGYRRIGTVTHPGRFRDFVRALRANQGGAFLRSFGVDFLVLDKFYAPVYLGLPAATVQSELQRMPDGLELIHDDSVAAIYRVHGPRPPTPTVDASRP